MSFFGIFFVHKVPELMIVLKSTGLYTGVADRYDIYTIIKFKLLEFFQGLVQENTTQEVLVYRQFVKQEEE